MEQGQKPFITAEFSARTIAAMTLDEFEEFWGAYGKMISIAAMAVQRIKADEAK
jgi:hypothetical protein